MDSFLISGIQQIGVGTVDFRKSWNWYIEMFGVDVKILEGELTFNNVSFSYPDAPAEYVLKDIENYKNSMNFIKSVKEYF